MHEYLYTHIHTVWSLERERERERWEDFTKQISIIHVQSYMFTNTYLQRTVLRSKFRQLLISFFLEWPFNSTPDDILNDSRFPYFRDVQNREQQKPPATSWHILAKLLVKELYELIEIQVAITINIHELKKNLHVRGGVAPFC